MWTRLCALAAALALTAACGNQQAVEATVQGQDIGGTPLAFGFTTVPDTALQGPVFPQPLQGSDGFVAVMTLTGDPTEVYDAFASQAAQMGYQIQPAKKTCAFSNADGLVFTPDGKAIDWTERPDNADMLFCGTSGKIQNGDDFDNAASLQLAISQGQYEGETQSTVTLNLQRVGTVPDTAPQPVPEPGVRGLGQPTSWEPPDRFGVEFQGLSMDVVGGSALAGPVGARASCAGGYFAVLRVSGDLTAVTDAYEDQIEEYGFEGGPLSDAGTADVRSYTTAGGGDYTLTTSQDESGKWLLVTRCND
jgi:hypothetical protein